MKEFEMEAAGRTLLMRFDTKAWMEIEEKFGRLRTLTDKLDEEHPRLTEGLELAAITANGGVRYRGRDEEPVSAAWLADHLAPKAAQRAVYLAKQAVIFGMRRDRLDADAQEDMDVVAAELRRKKAEAATSQPDSAPPAESLPG